MVWRFLRGGGQREEGPGEGRVEGGRVNSTIAISMERDFTTATGNAVEDLLVLHCGVS